jgi:outer membrane lipoprotein-sorting protein
MTGFSKSFVAAVVSVVIAALAVPLAAPAAAEKAKPSNPVGAGWDSKIKQAPVPDGQTLTAEQVDAIRTVSTYFNNVKMLQGRFEQTNPDKRTQRGKFYLMRPGRFRFDYNRPSRQVIVSDGRYLAIQDLDLNNEDVYSLENTPFRILLRENVNLLRDAKILAVEQTDHQIAVTLTDKSPDAPGQITVYLAKGETPQLAGWVTTDMQGGVTKVEVSDLSRPDTLKLELFKRRQLFMKSIQ